MNRFAFEFFSIPSSQHTTCTSRVPSRCSEIIMVKVAKTKRENAARRNFPARDNFVLEPAEYTFKFWNMRKVILNVWTAGQRLTRSGTNYQQVNCEVVKGNLGADVPRPKIELCHLRVNMHEISFRRLLEAARQKNSWTDGNLRFVGQPRRKMRRKTQITRRDLIEDISSLRISINGMLFYINSYNF